MNTPPLPPRHASNVATTSEQEFDSQVDSEIAAHIATLDATADALRDSDEAPLELSVGTIVANFIPTTREHDIGDAIEALIGKGAACRLFGG